MQLDEAAVTKLKDLLIEERLTDLQLKLSQIKDLIDKEGGSTTFKVKYGEAFHDITRSYVYERDGRPVESTVGGNELGKKYNRTEDSARDRRMYSMIAVMFTVFTVLVEYQASKMGEPSDPRAPGSVLLGALVMALLSLKNHIEYRKKLREAKEFELKMLVTGTPTEIPFKR